MKIVSGQFQFEAQVDLCKFDEKWDICQIIQK